MVNCDNLTCSRKDNTLATMIGFVLNVVRIFGIQQEKSTFDNLSVPSQIHKEIFMPE